MHERDMNILFSVANYLLLVIGYLFASFLLFPQEVAMDAFGARVISIIAAFIFNHSDTILS